MANFTKNAIKQSFRKLLRERPYSDITVKDIVADCGINRNSFYYHYHDLPSLVEEILHEDCDSVIQQHPHVSSFEECLALAVDFSQSNQRAVLHLFRSIDRSIFEQYLWKMCDYAVNSYINTAFANRAISEDDKRIIVHYYKCECFGQIAFWVAGGMREDIRSDFHRMCELKRGHAEEMIRRSEQSQSEKTHIPPE